METWLGGIWNWIAGSGVIAALAAWWRGWLMWLVPLSCPQIGRFLRHRAIELVRRARSPR